MIFSTCISLAQVDTTKLKREQLQQIEKMKEAQKKGLQQLKEMGIDIDPNKKMTKEEAQKLKNKLLQTGQQMKKQLEIKPVNEHKNVDISKLPTDKQVLQIADRFFNRSYKQLDAIEKNIFDLDYKEAEKNKFSLEAVRSLANKGAEIITFGSDHNFACVYLTSAVKSNHLDTLSVNNFGGYLRIIDSVQTSLPVLLYANELFSQSPVILTQIGCSLFELGDESKAEKYLKEALKYNPEFGQAHSALCEVYIRQNRLKDAIISLFAGVKSWGASYQQASITSQQIQQQYDASGKNDFESKEEFWDETKKQLEPPAGGGESDAEIAKFKMPSFPNCPKVEDWTMGGGHAAATQAYQSFHKYLMSFAEEFQVVHMQVPVLPENVVLRDYPNERFALDCITEMFMAYSKEESRKYKKTVDDIIQRTNDAKERYIENYNKYMEEFYECSNICGAQYESCRQECMKYEGEAREKCMKRCPDVRDICTKNCRRIYCSKQCPNANIFNEALRTSYGIYTNAFSQMVNKQSKLLDDLYAFSNPWFKKIYSPYWSKLYAYEIRRVALAIVGNTYMYYPHFFDPPVNDDCGTDCSVFANAFVLKPEEVNKDNPEGNNCPPYSKFKISLAICELGLDCESIEFGCTAGVSASVKKNFKKKNTTLFLGVGMKGGLGVAEAGAKAGVVITASDKGEIEDVGGKIDLSATVKVGASKFGASASGSLTVMKGIDSNAGFTGGLFKPK